MFYIYLNAPAYDDALFSFTLFSNIALFFKYFSIFILHRHNLDTFCLNSIKHVCVY